MTVLGRAERMGKFRGCCCWGIEEGKYMKVNLTLSYVVFWSYFSIAIHVLVGYEMGWGGME